MKREWLQEQLKDLPEDARKAVIDSIMAENGKDVNKAKGDLDTIKAEKQQLETELSTANTTIADLKQSQGDKETLQAKLTEYENTITTMRRDSILTKVLSKYKAKNEISVKAHINDIEAKDDKSYEALLDAKLKELSESPDTSFLFGEQQVVTHYNPDGGEPAPTKGYGATYAEARNTNTTPSLDPWASKTN